MRKRKGERKNNKRVNKRKEGRGADKTKLLVWQVYICIDLCSSHDRTCMQMNSFW